MKHRDFELSAFGIQGCHDEIDMQKLWSDPFRVERRLRFLKDNRHDIVADVTFTFQLLSFAFRIGQQGTDMKHDLMVLKLFIDRFSSCLVRLDIQATAESEGKDDDVVC